LKANTEESLGGSDLQGEAEFGEALDAIGACGACPDPSRQWRFGSGSGSCREYGIAGDKW